MKFDFKKIGRNDKQFWAGVCLVAALLLAAIPLSNLAAKQEAAAVAVSTSWGLSFQKEGQAPVGNMSAEELKKYGAYYVGNPDEKVIYLTFDAGYENGYTAQILDVLKAHNAPAAFFLVGNYIEQNPDLVRRMVEEGHTVGNHTYSHPDMSAISSKEAFAEQLVKLEALYEQVTGQEMTKLYRPPQGKFSNENLELSQVMGYSTILWSLAYRDWLQDDQPTKEQAFAKLIPRIHNGAIVLLHSTSKTNADILDELLTKWEDMGYTFETLEELTKN